MKTKGVLLVSLDFELLWGVQDTCGVNEYGENVLGGRRAIPQLLSLFEKYDIHATWATVGFQFASGYEEVSRFFPPKGQRPTYLNKALDPYHCFETIGKDEESAPCFYAATLLNQIASCKGQEVGTHTFSHYYCREKGQTPAQFRADMQAAQQIAESKGLKVESVVLPRNQSEPEYVEVLADMGFRTYRDEENDWIHKKIKCRPLMRLLRLMDVYLPLTGQGGYIPENENGIWNLMGSRMYKPIINRLHFLERLKIRRIKNQMRHAAKNGLVFHLWWHPHNIGVNTEEHLKQLDEIFAYYEEMKNEYGMRSMTMRECADELA